MSLAVEEYRQKEEDQARWNLWLWVMGSLALHILLVLLAIMPWPFSRQPPEEDFVEFTVVDPSALEDPNSDLQANANSEDGGEARPDEAPSAGRPAQSQAAPPAPTPAAPPAPPQAQPPTPPEPVQEAAQPEPVTPPPPVEEVTPPPAPPEPEPEPLTEQAIAQAPPEPAPTPVPTPSPAPTPVPTPSPIPTPPPEPEPQTRESTLEELLASQPTPPAPPAPPTRESSASQLGGPVAANSNIGTSGSAASSPINPTESNTNPPSVAASAQLDWGPYLARLQQRVERNWIPGQSNLSRRSIVTFVISRDGQVSNVRLAQSSGSQATDAAAVSAIQRSAPLEALPTAFPGNSVEIHFTFDLNVLGGQVGP